jgi:FixJ family two-component response regulator
MRVHSALTADPSLFESLQTLLTAALQPGVDTLAARYASLTGRERDVMSAVVAGRLNKQIAYQLGISEITVKVHRGQVMRKMQAASLPELVTMAMRIGAELLSLPSS